MASRRLLLSSSSSLVRRFHGSNWSSSSSHVLSSFPLDLDYCSSYGRRSNRETHHPHRHGLPMIQVIRPLSSSSSSSTSAQRQRRSLDEYRQRAREGAQVARDRAQTSARKGAKVARRGAKTAKEMMRQYGPVFVATYASVYFATLGGLFVGIDSGLLDPVQIMSYIGSGGDGGGGGAMGGMDADKSIVHLVVEYMEKYSWTRPYAETVEKNPHFASLAVAWVSVKFTEPVRLAVTLAIVPRLARHFGYVKVIDEHEDEGHAGEQGNAALNKEEDMDSKGTQVASNEQATKTRETTAK